ncbi:MAG: hypothetical protein VYE22_00640 [Myxococcota bacterium]|nr:hypothetical protein [Myxococcota bacterium]
MRDVSRSARRALACVLWAGTAMVGCAHGEASPGPAAALAADGSHEHGGTYSSSTDDSDLPDTGDPWAEQLGDAEVEATLEGTAVLWTREPEEATPPDDPHDRYVAVSPRFPAGTLVRVTRMDDGRSVTVQVRRQEELPFGLIALSEQAARHLGVQDRTELPVRIEVLVAPSAQLE